MEDTDKLLFFSVEGFSLAFPLPNWETTVIGIIETRRGKLLSSCLLKSEIWLHLTSLQEVVEI